MRELLLHPGREIVSEFLQPDCDFAVYVTQPVGLVGDIYGARAQPPLPCLVLKIQKFEGLAQKVDHILHRAQAAG